MRKKNKDQVFTSGRLLHGSCLDRLKGLPDASVDSIVTDPPYELGFMGKTWDNSGIAYSVELWGECLRVLKPGGHLLAFGSTRTYHRMAVAIEDAGFEIRDSIQWVYGSGFPKSMNVGKAIDKAAGAEREVVGTKKTNVGIQGGNFSAGSKTAEINVTAPATDAAKTWEGWGTALKPAHEPIVVARKPLVGTVAANVLAHGTGALNIDGCRVGDEAVTINTFDGGAKPWGNASGEAYTSRTSTGRWPANIIFDAAAGDELDEQSGIEASRFFYCPKPGKRERNAGTSANTHPTVKPVELMRYLVRLITPPGGTVLDPFLGSGTTAVAATLEGFQWIGCEMTADYLPIIKGRVTHAEAELEKKQPRLFDGGSK